MTEKIQRVEGLAIGVAVLFFYAEINASWLLFLILFLIPDITMLGYAKNKKLGANIYNLGHSFVLPLVLLIFSYSIEQTLLIELSLIWLAHIGFDRAMGYGLKYKDNFKKTHLGWVGKNSIVSKKE